MTAQPQPIPDALCINCQYNLHGQDHAGRCPECGTPVAASLIGCPHCKTKLPYDMRVCPSCRGDLGPEIVLPFAPVRRALNINKPQQPREIAAAWAVWLPQAVLMVLGLILLVVHTVFTRRLPVGAFAVLLALAMAAYLAYALWRLRAATRHYLGTPGSTPPAGPEADDLAAR